MDYSDVKIHVARMLSEKQRLAMEHAAAIKARKQAFRYNCIQKTWNIVSSCLFWLLVLVVGTPFMIDTIVWVCNIGHYFGQCHCGNHGALPEFNGMLVFGVGLVMNVIGLVVFGLSVKHIRSDNTMLLVSLFVAVMVVSVLFSFVNMIMLTCA